MQDTTSYEDTWLDGEDRPIGNAVEAARQQMKDEQTNAFVDAARELDGKEPIKREPAAGQEEKKDGE